MRRHRTRLRRRGRIWSRSGFSSEPFGWNDIQRHSNLLAAGDQAIVGSAGGPTTRRGRSAVMFLIAFIAISSVAYLATR